MEPLTLTFLLQTTGLAQMTWGAFVMIGSGGLLLYLAVAKEFEPVFLISFGFAVILTNTPYAGTVGPGGYLHTLYELGIQNGLFPALLFLGLGTLVDFAPLIAMPSLFFLGTAAQLGIFITLIMALLLSTLLGFPFALADAAAIGMIGGAYPPTVIFLTSRLAPGFLGAIAVATIFGMALLPLLQPPIMRALTSQQERQIVMPSLRFVSKQEKILFLLAVLLLCLLLLPAAMPWLGIFLFGNFLKESGMLVRMAFFSPVKTIRTLVMHAITLSFGLAVGSQLAAETFLSLETLAIVLLGVMAFSVGTATAMLMGKWLCYLSQGKVNPLLGAAGMAVVPLSARVTNKVGLEADPDNVLFVHALGANMAGVVASTVVVGFFLAIFTV